MIQRAGMQPDTTRAECPGIAHRARQQMFPKATAEFSGDDSEIRDLHGIVFSHAPQLVPSGQVGLLRYAAPPGYEQLNGWVREVLADLLVRPIPPVKPMEGLADRAVTHAVEIR